MIIDNGKELVGIEIKSGKTIGSDFFKGLEYWKSISGQQKTFLIYTGDDEFKYSNGNQVLNWMNGINI